MTTNYVEMNSGVPSNYVDTSKIPFETPMQQISALN